ncbi:hypothetical protein DAPPUDRAFT_326207 [Daphnia pulex]|uniref:Uncharacterized protein n=1 Tax=Daphnia pulex TaxID=6669 RepID=E9H6V7_DAPPU|nr:hypothetical protein DAPPUDRAFT_326207 [Daphnia pulex]|eukprot:EFX72500.1 hypothetical protein DAPPUDRAFT_326207 [Daphnia pulex]
MLFILTIWRKFDYTTTDKVVTRKAGEYLEADHAKVLEESNDVDKPVLRQVPVAKVTQDNNSTEQPKTDDD